MKAWRILAALLAAAAAGYVLQAAFFRPGTEAGSAARTDVATPPAASGRITAPYRVDIGSQIIGKVALVAASEGQTVKAGQVLIALEEGEARAGVKQAEAAVAQAEAARRAIETADPFSSDIAAATAAVAQARTELQTARARLAHTTITSPWDGTIAACNVARGEMVRPGKVLMVLAPDG